MKLELLICKKKHMVLESMLILMKVLQFISKLFYYLVFIGAIDPVWGRIDDWNHGIQAVIFLFWETILYKLTCRAYCQNLTTIFILYFLLLKVNYTQNYFFCHVYTLRRQRVYSVFQNIIMSNLRTGYIIIGHA